MKTLFLLLFLSACGDSPFVEDLKDQTISGATGLSGAHTLSASRYDVEVRWQSGPAVYDEGSLIILLRSPSGNLADFPSGNLSAHLWMPSMGHGSYPITITRLSSGIYQASEVFFTMPGDWDLHIERKVDSQVIESLKIRYDL